jgi:hypothetical protein
MFKFAIGELTLKFEGVTNEGVSELLRLLTARILEEISEAMNRRRQRLYHQQLGLPIEDENQQTISPQHDELTPRKG